MAGLETRALPNIAVDPNKTLNLPNLGLGGGGTDVGPATALAGNGPRSGPTIIPQIAPYTAPTLPGAPTPTALGNFTAPDMAAYLNSQEFQDQLGQSQRAIQHSAAAHGTLLNTGTLKSLQDDAAREARSGYQQHFTNALDTYRTNAGTNAQNFGQLQTQFGDKTGLYDRSVNAAHTAQENAQTTLDRNAAVQQSAQDYADSVAAQRQAENARLNAPVQRGRGLVGQNAPQWPTSLGMVA